jgi:thioester reductase-like protein
MEFVTDFLNAWAGVQPNKPLFSFVGADGAQQDGYTCSRFAEATRHLAGWLRRAHGLRLGERVLLAYSPGLNMIAAFFACARAGVIPVPVAKPAGLGGGLRRGTEQLAHLGAIAVDCGAHTVLTDHTPPGWTPSGGLRWIATAGFEPDGRGFADDPSPVLFLQYTSGATGRPRGVIVSHRNIIANAHAVLGEVPVGTQHAETGVSWLPQHHDMGLIGYYLFPVVVGGATVGLSPLDFLRRPALWLQTISRARGTYASAPDFGFEHCLRPGKIGEDELRGLDLSSLRWLMSAAEPIRPATRERFIARFAPFGLRADACIAAYGLAENTLAATHYGVRTVDLDPAALRCGRVRAARTSGTDRDQPLQNGGVQPSGGQVRIASCGVPLPGVGLRIVDPASQSALCEREIGEVWLTGPSVCAGYWGVPPDACESFAQRLAARGENPAGAWLRTGDLGFLDGGELFICGRSKDVIILRGANHYPQDIEAAVESVPGVRPGSVAAFSGAAGTLTVMVESPAGRPLPSPAQIARTVQARCQVLPETVVLVPPGSIIWTTSGKLARRPTRERFTDGRISVLLTWHPDAQADDAATVAELRARLTALLADAGLDEETTSLADVGLDSLMLTDLLLSLEGISQRLGASDLARRLDLPLLQRLSVTQFRRLLDALDGGGASEANAIGTELARLRDAAAAATARRMQEDAKLDCADKTTGTCIRFAPHTPVTDVLMTGATGFFGPFLLESLLRQTSWRFRVLVRAADPEHAQRRLRSAMAGSGLLPTALANGLQHRVEVVCGDVAAANWGLVADEWEHLAEETQAVVHNAAAVNWVANYEALRRVNVDGTRTMLQFARTGIRKRVHHISTTFIFGWTARELLLESDNNETMANLDFGYAQTKWVAEQLVLAARRQGMDARIYRPAIVSASTAGIGHPADAAVRVLAFMINHGIAVRTENQLSILAADVAADNIASIIALDEAPGSTFHVTVDDYYNIVDMTRVLTAEHGYTFTYYGIPEFIAEMNRRCSKTDPLYPLLDFFNGSAARIEAMQLKRYNNRAYREACSHAERRCADPTLSATVASLVACLRAQRLIKCELSPSGACS